MFYVVSALKFIVATYIWQKLVVSTYLFMRVGKAPEATLAPCLDTVVIRLINDRWAAGQAVSIQRVVDIVVALC